MTAHASNVISACPARRGPPAQSRRRLQGTQRLAMQVCLGLSTFAAIAATSGCTTVRTTEAGAIGLDRKQRMSPLVSEASLQQGAETAYAQEMQKQRGANALNTDAQLTQRVRAIAQRVIAQAPVFRSDAAQWKWEVNLVQTDELNAWCMPGGKIAVYSGLVNRLQMNDAEIAAVLGHEIAHALREHARERASEKATAGLLIGLGSTALGAGAAGSQMTELAYQSVFGTRHSREQETEADRVGVELAARAGYDPRAAVGLWQKMQQAAGSSSGPAFLSTHPSAGNRIADLRVYSERVMPLYQQAGGRP